MLIHFILQSHQLCWTVPWSGGHSTPTLQHSRRRWYYIIIHQRDWKFKAIIKVFKDHGLSITIWTGLDRVNFLDVTMDLQRDEYKPYRKPGDKPMYVNFMSNHPPQVLKNIPLGINKRLCEISSSKEVFLNAIPPYQKELDECGYNYKLVWIEEGAMQSKEKKTRPSSDSEAATMYKLKGKSLNLTHCILCIASYALHLTHCILHIASDTLHLTHCILHTASYTLHSTICILGIEPYVLRGASYTLHRSLKSMFLKS